MRFCVIRGIAFAACLAAVFSGSIAGFKIFCPALNFDVHTIQNVLGDVVYSELELKHNNYHLTLM